MSRIRLTRLGFLPLLAPTWLVLGGLLVVPLLGILLISFARSDDLGFPLPVESLSGLWDLIRSGAFLDNYAKTLGLSDDGTRSLFPIFWRSIWMAVATTVFCGLISYPTAYYIAVRAPAFLKDLLLALAVIPFWTSFVIRTYAWMTILRPQGLLNIVLLKVGVIDQPLDLLYTNFAVMIGLVYGELPFMILPLYASLEKLDRSLLEASADLGAGTWSTFRRVTFPLSLPGLVAGIVLVFVPSVGQFVVSDMLGGAKVTLVGNLVQDQFAGSSGVADKPYGAAIAFELTALVLLMIGVYAWWAKRRGEEVLL